MIFGRKYLDRIYLDEEIFGWEIINWNFFFNHTFLAKCNLMDDRSVTLRVFDDRYNALISDFDN